MKCGGGRRKGACLPDGLPLLVEVVLGYGAAGGTLAGSGDADGQLLEPVRVHDVRAVSDDLDGDVVGLHAAADDRALVVQQAGAASGGRDEEERREEEQ